MLVVSDTSALLALAACDALPLLDRLFETVRVPAAVLRECAVSGKTSAERLARYLEGRVVDVDPADILVSSRSLGRGEMEAMALYRRLGADWLLVDDARARKVARLNGIQVIGSLGVLLLARGNGLVPRIRPLIEAIRASGIYLADSLVEEALRLAEEQ